MNDDPAAPLEAYLGQTAWMSGVISDDVPLQMIFVPSSVALTFGDLRRAVAAIRSAEVALANLRDFCACDNEDICQALGLALGYPRFADDHASFPGATDAAGVCVGDHVAASIAAEAAHRIVQIEAALEAAKKTNEALVAEVERLTDERNLALRLYGRLTEGGPMDRPPEYYEAIGRRALDLPEGYPRGLPS